MRAKFSQSKRGLIEGEEKAGSEQGKRQRQTLAWSPAQFCCEPSLPKVCEDWQTQFLRDAWEGPVALAPQSLGNVISWGRASHNG